MSWALTLLEVRFVGHTITSRVLETFRHQRTPKLVRTFSTQAISSRGISDDGRQPQPVVSRVAAFGTCFGLTGDVPQMGQVQALAGVCWRWNQCDQEMGMST